MAQSAFTVAPNSGNDSGRLLAIQVFTSSGTYTPTSGTTQVRVKATAAGGGGGTTNSTITIGGAGGGGEYAECYFANAVSQAVTIGQGGVGGGANNGTAPTDGGNTTFGALVTAIGGTGSTNASLSGVGGAGGTGGTIQGTGFKVAGQQGGDVALNATPTFGGMAYGNSACLRNVAPNTGVANTGQGGGGGNSAVNGGAGGSGFMIIEEYS